MDRYFKRKTVGDSSQNNESENPNLKRICEIVDHATLPSDPGVRPPIWSYNVNSRDEVRRTYLQKGPCQPYTHEFPYSVFGNDRRRFNPVWFNEFPAWLEYSVDKNAAFCLYCYLFKRESDCATVQGGGDSFVGKGFRTWKKKEKMRIHEGKHNSGHNEARKKCEDLMKEAQGIQHIFISKTNKDKKEYRVLLTAAVDCVRFLLRQGLPFRGNDEDVSSMNKGNYLELFHFLVDHNEEVKKVSFSNASEKVQMTSPIVQKDICRAGAVETLNVIMEEVGDSYFSVLVDESRDVSIKEQMAVALRFVDKNGHVIERFVGLKHVTSTTVISLKAGLEDLLAQHKLSISRIRGQGYDGASNMHGEFNGLKSLMLRDNPSAFYVHCFAHQLQLALVAVAKKHFQVKALFEFVSMIINTVGSSCKRSDALKAIRHEKILKELKDGDLPTGRGLNQETNLQRSGDTRWGSHYTALMSLRHMYYSVMKVLEIVMEDAIHDPKSIEASVLLDQMHSFDFIFSMHMMISVLGVTNELSKALQRKDQDIDNAMRLVGISKQLLRKMRGEGWDSFFNEVSSFCSKFEVDIPNMEDKFKPRGRPKRGAEEKTNDEHYRIGIFNTVVDWQVNELDNRFSEASTELLCCVAALNPSDLFLAFDKEKLLRLAQLYRDDFSPIDIAALGNQLEVYIADMRTSDMFSKIHGITDLAVKLVGTKNHLVYPLVYKLIKLALTLPVATATVERAFSAMKIVKQRLRNRMGDEWLNDCLIPYIEKEVFDQVPNEAIIQYYQNMKTRRKQL